MKFPRYIIMGIISSLIMLQAIKAADEPVPFTDTSIAFAYESRAEIPASKENLARIISIDYRRAPDEFTARELFKKLEPVVDRKLNEAKKTKPWRIIIGSHLGQYDFKKEAFPSGLSKDTFIPYDNYYAVRFTNAEAFALLPVKLEDAKKISGALQRDRSCTVLVEGIILSVKEDKINYTSRKAVSIKITKVTLKLRDELWSGPRKNRQDD